MTDHEPVSRYTRWRPPTSAVFPTWYEAKMSWLSDLLKKSSPAPDPEPEGDGYAFRIRLVLPERRNITHDGKELRLTPAEDVRLVADNGAEKIDGAKNLLLIGRGYGSQPAAEEAGRKWRGLFERSAALMQLGADFGDRVRGGGLGGEYQQQLEAETGRPIIDNNYGLQVFKESPWPMFVAMSAGLSTGAPTDILTTATEVGRQIGLTTSDRESLAYDLYAASFFQKGPDARYLMLMTALEALIEPQPRPTSSIEHVERLIKLTCESELHEPEIRSMVGTLEWLKEESIGQAGRRLVAQLGERRYMDGNESPVQFFTRCYALRSSLVHGHVPRPAESDVGSRAANLEVFVAHLISGKLLAAVDIDAIVAARQAAG
jgi:hypothetical protein